MRYRFLPVAEALYRKRRGVLVKRDCMVGHVPRHQWPRIAGRKQFRQLRKVRPWEHLTF
jgi:hypothetical protein